MADPAEDIDGLNSLANVSKPETLTYLKNSLYHFTTAASVRAADLSGRNRIMVGDRFFKKDNADLGTDDGTETATVIIDFAGNHWLYIPPAGAAQLIFINRAALQATSVVASIQTVLLESYTSLLTGGRAVYKRVNAEPSHEGKIRSLDRFLVNGTVSAGNGGWWEMVVTGEVDIRAFGAVADAVQTDPAWFGATVDNATDTFTVTSHPWNTQDAVRVRATTMPGGVDKDLVYYVIDLTANTFKLAQSKANAVAGTPVVNVTSNGTAVEVRSRQVWSGTDQTAVLDAAKDFGELFKVGLYAPTGKYYFADAMIDGVDLGAIVYSFLIIRGDPGGGTKFIIDEDLDWRMANAVGGSQLFDTGVRATPFTINKELCSFTDIEFHGIWTQAPGGDDNDPLVGSMGINPIRAEGTARVDLIRVGFFDIRNKGFRGKVNTNFLAQNCYGERCCDGFVRNVSGDVSIAIGCRFAMCDDDAIDFNATEDMTVNAPAHVIVSGNKLSDCEAISCNLGRQTEINGNTLERCKGTGIKAIFGAQSHQAMFGVDISHNSITDHLMRVNTTDWLTISDNGGGGGAIQIDGSEKSAISTSVPPGDAPTPSGIFVLPFGTDGSQAAPAGYMHGKEDGVGSLAAGYGFHISHNTVQRTLRDVANYSLWGKGLMFTKRGFRDPPVDSLEKRAYSGIKIAADMEEFEVSHNLVNGHEVGLLIVNSNSSFRADAFRAGLIESNVFRRLTTGVKSVGPTSPVGRWSLAFFHNLFDIDPECQLSNRNTDGSWDSTGATNELGRAIFMDNAPVGLVLHHNICRNAYQFFGNGLGTVGENDLFNNLLVCEPSVVGFNAANKGIGVVELSGPSFRYMIVRSDPTQANFRQVLNACLVQAASIPTTGFYVRGHYVHNNSPSAGTNVTIGWARLTTGSAHVADTDWKAIRGA